MLFFICNAGSTSLKCKLLNMPQKSVLAAGRIERIGTAGRGIVHFSDMTGKKLLLENQTVMNYADGLNMFFGILSENEQLSESFSAEKIDAVIYKTVLAKGFPGIHELTEDVLRGMKDYIDIAPVHNSCYLEVIGVLKEMLPGVRHIGVFETAFHQTIPPEARLYSVPYKWYEEYGIQRYGFHGASHRYISQRMSVLAPDARRIVSCHLGGSCSLCAIADGKSTDTSFGLSLQCGVLHSNRCGDIDPYLIPYLQKQGMALDDILNELNTNAGLLGISGVSKDVRDLRKAAHEGNTRASLALDMFCHDIIKYIGAFAAEMEGVDAICFTAGIGENDAELRTGVCSRLAFLGVELDEEKNRNTKEDVCISREGSRCKVFVIHTDEEISIAEQAYEYLTNNN